jgi:Reverse transcriptase (RNA-dependent DNA polymerase)
VISFDRVNHDKLMGRIAKRVEDKRLLRLIRAFLNAGVMENGLVRPSVEGAPQGGPLSPLLSNLVLDELDRELERRGHRFVRYADDGNIYVRSERAGHRVMESITRFITQKLQLKVNEAKSAVARPQERKFLGFSFTNDPEPKRKIAPKALDRFKRRIREITRRAKGVSIKADCGGIGPVYGGLAQLLRLLRNARSVGVPHSLDSQTAPVCSVATVENRSPSHGGADPAGCEQSAGAQYCRQPSRRVAPQPEQSPFHWAFQCLLQIDRPSFVDWAVLAQPIEPPCTDPYARWCGRGKRVTASPMPINIVLGRKCVHAIVHGWFSL